MRAPFLALGLLVRSFAASAADLPLNSAVTQETIGQTICVMGWTKTVRPAAAYAAGIKAGLLRELGMAQDQAIGFELDHRIPLALSGAPADPRNAHDGQSLQCSVVAEADQMTGPWPLAWAALSYRLAAKGELDMTQDNSNKDDPGVSGKEADKYTGMVDIDFDLTPSVIICGVAGAVLGFILGMWATSSIPITFATTIVFAVLSGIFGMFVPWYKRR